MLLTYKRYFHDKEIQNPMLIMTPEQNKFSWFKQCNVLDF